MAGSVSLTCVSNFHYPNTSWYSYKTTMGRSTFMTFLEPYDLWGNSRTPHDTKYDDVTDMWLHWQTLRHMDVWKNSHVKTNLRQEVEKLLFFYYYHVFTEAEMYSIHKKSNENQVFLVSIASSTQLCTVTDETCSDSMLVTWTSALWWFDHQSTD